MNILLLNCSIKRKNSRSLRLSHAFVEGLKQNKNIKEDINVNEICLYDEKIEECKCCYYCWREESQGKCIQKDDMKKLLKFYIDVDLVVWSFPLLFFGFPAVMKKFIERTFPLYTSEKLSLGETHYIQSARYPKLSKRREVFISSCGLPHRSNNYEAVDETLRIQFEERADKIYCVQGTLFEEKRFERIVKRYLESIRIAGKNYSLVDGMTKKDKDRLFQSLVPEELYYKESNMNKQWLKRQIGL